MRNLVVATGHAMMGLSLGPITGRLMSEILSGEKPSIDLSLLKQVIEEYIPFNKMLGILAERVERGSVRLVLPFRDELIGFDGATLGVNLGYDRVRFPAPVRTGARVRATSELLLVEPRDDGWVQTVTRFTVEVEGENRPACVADSVVRVLLP